MLVKFSPPVNTEVGQRWSDLLVAEHLAHAVLNDGGVRAARSEIHSFEGVTFLELDRFDRQGLNGRVGVTSLMSIDATQYGMIDNWNASAVRLHRDRRIDAQTMEAMRLVHAFGGLIANTALAEQYWARLSADARVSDEFRAIAATCGDTLAALPRTGAYEYAGEEAPIHGR